MASILIRSYKNKKCYEYHPEHSMEVTMFWDRKTRTEKYITENIQDND